MTAGGWQGGQGKYGAFRESAKKDEVPKALIGVGGMRDPLPAVDKLPTVKILGEKLWSLWQAFLVRRPGALEVAETYGTERCRYSEDVLQKWRNRLKGTWAAVDPQVRLRAKGVYRSPVETWLLKAWQKSSGDPEVHVVSYMTGRRLVKFPGELFRFAMAWMLRELELASLTTSDLLMDHLGRRVTLTLKASKMDQSAQGSKDPSSAFVKRTSAGASAPTTSRWTWWGRWKSSTAPARSCC